MSVFGDRLKLLRNEKLKTHGLTQKKLGNMFNVEKGTVSNWENGNRTPDIEVISKLADLFDVSVDYLLGRTDKRKPNHLTKEDMIKLAPEYAWLFEEEGLKYIKLVEGIKADDIPPEAVEEIIDTILKYRHLNKK
ncbi:MAG: helix-turn-helix transcriptional regulator [Tissierella sp.]|nr:helix-turn-helix transcriptional regulator [Tissierella sp.]